MPILRTTGELQVTRTESDFEEFFLAHYDAIVNSLYAMTGDRDRATDATQEAFIKAYARWPKIRSYDIPAAWVRRIAINASRDRHRSEVRRARRERTQREQDSYLPTDAVVSDDAAVRMLAGLPRRQREVATLFYIDDLGIEEIAQILNVTVGTVKSQLAGARDHMRSRLQRDGAEP